MFGVLSEFCFNIFFFDFTDHEEAANKEDKEKQGCKYGSNPIETLFKLFSLFNRLGNNIFFESSGTQCKIDEPMHKAYDNDISRT